MRREKHSRVRAESWQIAALLIAGSLSVWGMAVRADRGMRADLLRQTRLVAQAVDLGQVKALTGTPADLASPAYRAAQEAAISRQAGRRGVPVCLSAGPQASGAVFFLVDSEPAGAPDYSPPGTSMARHSKGFRRIFDTKTETAVGPVTDRWGTWVAALVPLSDPQSGQMLAVLGVAIDARAWKSEVAARAALPTGLIAGVADPAGGRASSRPGPERTPRSSRLQRRLMAPLAAMLVVLVGGFAAVMVIEQRERLNSASRLVMQDAAGNLARMLAEQTRALEALEEILVRDAGLREALKARDRPRLLAAYAPVLAQLRSTHGITHFYFSDPDRVCLLRVHQPEKHGDRFDRFTAREAQRTGKTASGIELGPLGTFTLRVVRPVYDGGALVGYLELGQGDRGRC